MTSSHRKELARRTALATVIVRREDGTYGKVQKNKDKSK